MKAVRIHCYGGPEVLEYEDIPCPDISDDEVLIHVHAAGVNPVDWKVREGQLADFLKHALPLVLGWDASGTVERVGAAVTAFKPGDSVFTHSSLYRNGAYAEYVAVKASEVALKPESLDYIHAAAVPLAALTAWQSLFVIAGLSSGQRILIHGAAGGVGHYAVQFAKWIGAHVVGTASLRNHDLLRDMGAHEVIDYTTTAFEEVVDDMDVVFDTRSGDTRERSWEVLRKGGILVSTLPPPPSEEKASELGVRCAFVFVRPDALHLGKIAELIDSGHVKPFVQDVFALKEVRKAHELSQAGHVRGKLVLNVPTRG